MAVRFKALLSVSESLCHFNYNCPQPRPFVSFSKKSQFRISGSAAKMADKTPSQTKIIDSHLHVWAFPQEVKLSHSNNCWNYFSLFLRIARMSESLHFYFFLKAADKYPYFPGQEPTLPGNVDFLLEVCMPFMQTYECVFLSLYLRLYMMIFW